MLDSPHAALTPRPSPASGTGAAAWAAFCCKGESASSPRLCRGAALLVAPVVAALASQASMSGSIEDAQSRLNLHNLVRADGSLDPAQRDVLARLASELSLPEPTADLISAYLMGAFAPIAAVSPDGQPVGSQPRDQ